MISLQADESLEENGGTTGEDYYNTNEVKLANKMPLIFTVRNPHSSKKHTSATDSKEINQESIKQLRLHLKRKNVNLKKDDEEFDEGSRSPNEITDPEESKPKERKNGKKKRRINGIIPATSSSNASNGNNLPHAKPAIEDEEGSQFKRKLRSATHMNIPPSATVSQPLSLNIPHSTQQPSQPLQFLPVPVNHFQHNPSFTHNTTTEKEGEEHVSLLETNLEPILFFYRASMELERILNKQQYEQEAQEKSVLIEKLEKEVKTKQQMIENLKISIRENEKQLEAYGPIELLQNWLTLVQSRKIIQS